MMDYLETKTGWNEIYDPAKSLIIEERAVPISGASINILMEYAPFSRRAEGTLAEVLASLAALPDDVVDDISKLGARFMKLMQIGELRVRIEGVTSNACKKLHADYTDLRLITTYEGPGTDYADHADCDADCGLERLPTGAIGLFKGKLFGAGHTPCLHRSPPIEGSGQERIVLVIDTPERGKP